MKTTEARKQGTALLEQGSALLDTTTHAVSEIADRASDLADRAKKQAEAAVSEVAERLTPHKERPRRRRRLLLGAAIAGLAVGLAKLARKTGIGRKVEDRIIDLTGGRTEEAADGFDPVVRGGA